MTTQLEAAVRQALAALEKCDSALAEELAAWDIDPPLQHVLDASNACDPAITALRSALEQQAAQEETSDCALNLCDPSGPHEAGCHLAKQRVAQEPVAWVYQNSNTEHEYLVWKKGSGGRNWRPLYDHPAPRRLTDEELYEIFPAIATYTEANKSLYRSIARAIEAAHGIGDDK